MAYTFEDFGNDLGVLLENVDDKTQKKFLNSEARALRDEARKEAENVVEEHTGSYFDGFKYERAKTKNKRTYAKTINDSNHGHLVEDGHIIVGKDGKERGFVKGKHVIANASEAYKDTFNQNAEDFVAEAIGKSGLD
jgi:hypothetical protein